MEPGPNGMTVSGIVCVVVDCCDGDSEGSCTVSPSDVEDDTIDVASPHTVVVTMTVVTDTETEETEETADSGTGVPGGSGAT